MRHLHALLLAALLPLAASAADSPPALKQLLDNHAVLENSFPAVDGLTGWVVKLTDRRVIVYTTPSGGYVFGAPLVDKDGNNLTQQYFDKYIMAPQAESLAAALAKDLAVVEEGKPNAPLVYAYADPNCIFCNHLWTQLRPFLDAGKVRVRWVMVAFLKESSPGRSAAILAAKDKVAALALDETQFDTAHEEGGIPPLSPIPPQVSAALLAHGEQLREVGDPGTPLLLFRRGGQWALSAGLPKDMAAFVAALDPK